MLADHQKHLQRTLKKPPAQFATLGDWAKKHVLVQATAIDPKIRRGCHRSGNDALSHRDWRELPLNLAKPELGMIV
jgi:hypothetical protein